MSNDQTIEQEIQAKTAARVTPGDKLASQPA